MKVKHTLIAFVVLLALGGVFYYLNSLPQKPDENAIPKENLFSFTPDQVEEFTLEEASKPPATFRRTAASPAPAVADSNSASEPSEKNKDAAPQWEITAPEGIDADSNLIQDFLEQIAGMQGTPLPTDAPPEWSEYGLDAPEKSYQFKLKDGKTVDFSIGAENPAGYARYARRDGAAPVLLIDSIADKLLIERTLFDLRNRTILPIDWDQVGRLELHFNLEGRQSAESLAQARQMGLPVQPAQIVMTKEPNGNWNLDEPRLRTDHGTTNYLVTSLTGGMMRSVEEERAASLAKYGLNRPQIRLNVTTPSGVQSLLIGNSFKRGDDEFFYAKNTTWPHVFTVGRSVYDQLNQNLEAYRQRYLYDFVQGSVHSLELQGPTGQFRFGRRGEDWFMAGSPEKKMDGASVSSFLNSIHALRISHYPSDATGRFAAYGLDKPWLKTKVTFGQQNQEESILFSRKDNKFFAAREGEPSVYELSPYEPDNLIPRIKELTGAPESESQSASKSPAPATQ
ncbi:MAG: DUF4340 domain-containing protein [Acidobacteria bacterium]|nr:DUF4340 domain-containing protein [Acidobacteriota bacterium]